MVENVVDLLLAQAKGTQEVSIIYLVFINRYLPSKDEIQHFILIYIILATLMDIGVLGFWGFGVMHISVPG